MRQYVCQGWDCKKRANPIILIGMFKKGKSVSSVVHSAVQPFPVVILGGTTEAASLCKHLEQDARFNATLSLAGVTRAPHLPDLPVKIGGFGGVQGLKNWLQKNGIRTVVDATHPFAATMSHNAATACTDLALPLLRLERPAWQPTGQDNWHAVASLAEAAMALANPDGWGKTPLTVFLTTGRKDTRPFQQAPRHHYILRSIELPDEAALPPHTTLITARGPFGLDDELRLLRAYEVDVLVTKNSGGDATFPKLQAARILNIPVIMIERPHPSPAPVVATAEDALQWLVRHQSASTFRDV